MGEFLNLFTKVANRFARTGFGQTIGGWGAFAIGVVLGLLLAFVAVLIFKALLKIEGKGTRITLCTIYCIIMAICFTAYVYLVYCCVGALGGL